MKSFKKTGLLIITGFVLLAMSACGSTEQNSDGGMVKEIEETEAEVKYVDSQGVTDTINTIKLSRVDETGIDGVPASKDDCLETGEYIKEIQEEINEYADRNYQDPEDYAAAIERVNNLAEKWRGDGIVTTVTNHGDYIYIEFSNGIHYIFKPFSSETSSAAGDLQVSIITAEPFKTEFDARNEETKNICHDCVDGAAQKIADAYDQFIWKTDLDNQDVTLGRVFSDFSTNEMILWNGHGLYTEEEGPCLVLTETIYDTYYENFSFMVLANSGCYVITPKMINTYVGDMSGSFIYLNSCSGLRTTALCDAFQNKGAAAIVANSDVINTIYASNIMAATMENMLEGNDLDTSMAAAKEIYGNQDSNFYKDSGALASAVPTVYCGGDYCLAVEKEENDLEDGRYTGAYVADSGTEFPTDGNIRYAKVEDGKLTIDGTVGYWNSDWTNFTKFDDKKRVIKLADGCTIASQEAEEARSTDENEFNEMFGLGSSSAYGIWITITIQNGEVVSILFGA